MKTIAAKTKIRMRLGAAVKLVLDSLGFTLSAAIQEKKGADVATAGSIVVPKDGNFHIITGTTAIDYIQTTGWQVGARIILQANGTGAINNNTGTVPTNYAAILTNTGGNITTAAGKLYSFVYDGTTWNHVI